jgi:hypothetical protein
VLALEAGGGLGLAEKARDRVRDLQRLRQHELDRYALFELHVLGGDHHAHPADAEHALDFVLAREDFAGLDGRRHDHRSVHHGSCRANSPARADVGPLPTRLE